MSQKQHTRVGVQVFEKAHTMGREGTEKPPHKMHRKGKTKAACNEENHMVCHSTEEEQNRKESREGSGHGVWEKAGGGGDRRQPPPC